MLRPKTLLIAARRALVRGESGFRSWLSGAARSSRPRVPASLLTLANKTPSIFPALRVGFPRSRKSLSNSATTLWLAWKTCVWWNARTCPDQVHSFTVERSVFIKRIKLMSGYPHRLLVVKAPLSRIRTPYPHSAASPNRIFQSLLALLAGLNLPALCTDNQNLGEELVTSYLYQIHLYYN